MPADRETTVSRRGRRLAANGLALLLLAGCAGAQRSCSSMSAGAFGADWVVVQYSATGAPMNCWQLRGVSVANESQSDGVHWQDRDGHLVHIAGTYARVQVAGGDFAGAARQIGVDLGRCAGGRYAEAAR